MGDYGMDYQGGGGGGFNSGGGGSQEAPSSSGGKTRRSYDEQTLIPCTLRMLLRSRLDTAGGDGTLILEDGRKLSSVKIVAAVRSVEDASTNVVYTIEDGTGLMEAKQWMDDNQCSAVQEIRQQTLQEHIYVKVIGTIKEYEGKKIIAANSVRPLSSGNELTHHMVEVVYSAERTKRAESIVGGLPNVTSNGIGFGVQGAAITSSSTNHNGESAIKSALTRLFQSSDTGGQGLHISVPIQDLSGSFQEAEIRKAVEELSEEGIIYSTITDEHFQFAS